MAAREAGFSMAKFRADPAVAAHCFIRAVERYGYEGVVVDFDTATLAEAIGVPVELPENEPARCRAGRLQRLDDLDRIGQVDIARCERVQVWLETARLLKRHFKSAVLIRGNCDQAPFSLAALIRGIEGWFLDLLDPTQAAKAHALLRFCTAVVKQFIGLMIEAGADMTSNGDSVAGPDMISPGLYRAFALPYEREIAAFAHSLGTPHLFHVCGNATLILEDLVSTGADAIELDSATDIRRAERVFRNRTTFVGNLDPVRVLWQGTPRLVAAKTRELLAVFADNPRLILNAGCAIAPDTPPENIQTLIRMARSMGDIEIGN